MKRSIKSQSSTIPWRIGHCLYTGSGKTQHRDKGNERCFGFKFVLPHLEMTAVQRIIFNITNNLVCGFKRSLTSQQQINNVSHQSQIFKLFLKEAEHI